MDLLSYNFCTMRKINEKYANKMTVNSNMQQQQKNSDQSKSVALATSQNFNNLQKIRLKLMFETTIQLRFFFDSSYFYLSASLSWNIIYKTTCLLLSNQIVSLTGHIHSLSTKQSHKRKIFPFIFHLYLTGTVSQSYNTGYSLNASDREYWYFLGKKVFKSVYKAKIALAFLFSIFKICYAVSTRNIM